MREGRDGPLARRVSALFEAGGVGNMITSTRGEVSLRTGYDPAVIYVSVLIRMLRRLLEGIPLMSTRSTCAPHCFIRNSAMSPSTIFPTTSLMLTLERIAVSSPDKARLKLGADRRFEKSVELTPNCDTRM